MRRPTTLLSVAFSALLTLIASFNPQPAAAATMAAAGDASIVRNETAGTWTLTAGGTALTLTLDSGRDFSVAGLTTASGISWATVPLADSTLKIGSQTYQLGNRSAGFALQDVSFDTQGSRLQLDAVFDFASAKIRVTRHYVIVSGSPTFEAWTTYEPTNGAVILSDLNALRIVLPTGVVRSLTGLRGDAADVASANVFTLQQGTLGNGAHFEIGSKARASETSVPWIAIDGAKDEFFAAIMWSGAWSLTLDRAGAAVTMAAGLAPMTTALKSAIDGPHVLFGVVPGGLPQASAALRGFVVDGLRGGRELLPLVTYNTWFAYGTQVDQESMLAEMDSAAALGVELFVLDAGWYPGAGADGPFDFDAGLGSWVVDPQRFPNGLRPLRNHAHELGMKFGVWVEPERVNLSVVGQSELDESWLATSGGEYGSDHAAQICLSAGAARQWILQRLETLIDEVQPDYLKWDNNMWVNCDRPGHEHGAGDGNFAQVNGLYEVLSTIRQQYPNLLIENVSGGGNRLDLGMLRYTDAAWMDDRTAPSVHVRHNIEGLSAAFPPAYLLSFVTDHDTEPIHDSPDLSLYVRSRMTGILGLCFRTEDLSEADSSDLSHEIGIYKSLRDTLSVSAGSLLTKQAQNEDGPAWDVLQATAAGNLEALICAYQTDEGVDTIIVKPIDLDTTVTYSVQSVDSGALGEATGAALMKDGIEIQRSPTTAAHILIVRAQQ